MYVNMNNCMYIIGSKTTLASCFIKSEPVDIYYLKNSTEENIFHVLKSALIIVILSLIPALLIDFL